MQYGFAVEKGTHLMKKGFGLTTRIVWFAPESDQFLVDQTHLIHGVTYITSNLILDCINILNLNKSNLNNIQNILYNTVGFLENISKNL